MRNDASMSTMDVAVQNDSCRRSVTAQFQFARRQFGLSAYSVMLVHGNDFWQRIVDNNQKRLLVNEVDYFNDGVT